MIALITGSSNGIGKAIAEKFLEEGFEVVGVDVADATISSPRYTHVQADILYDELPSLSPDVLVNDAGVQNSGKDIDINLKATIRVTERYLSPTLKSVLFIASASASTGAEFPEYAASKGGVVAYMKNVALRLAPHGIANSLSPGGVTTSLNESVMNNEECWQKIMDETPMKKWASAEEIAEWAYFISVVNKSMTAQDILVDNGESARSNFIWK